jgi:hypothetical protein
VIYNPEMISNRKHLTSFPVEGWVGPDYCGPGLILWAQAFAGMKILLNKIYLSWARDQALLNK